MDLERNMLIEGNIIREKKCQRKHHGCLHCVQAKKRNEKVNLINMELHFNISLMITGEKRHRKDVSDSDQSDDLVSRKKGAYSKQSSSSDNN